MLKKQLDSKVVKFILVGIWNTAIGYLSFIILELLFSQKGTHYMIALTASQVIIIGNAYLCYKYLVFKTPGVSWGEPSRFALIYGLNFVGNLILLPLFVNFAKMTPIIGQGFVVVILATGNFLAHNNFTFRPHSGPDPDERVAIQKGSF